jgi:hypothetical protein
MGNGTAVQKPRWLSALVGWGQRRNRERVDGPSLPGAELRGDLARRVAGAAPDQVELILGR